MSGLNLFPVKFYACAICSLDIIGHPFLPTLGALGHTRKPNTEGSPSVEGRGAHITEPVRPAPACFSNKDTGERITSAQEQRTGKPEAAVCYSREHYAICRSSEIFPFLRHTAPASLHLAMDYSNVVDTIHVDAPENVLSVCVDLSPGVGCVIFG